jgi:hypothetical protein
MVEKYVGLSVRAPNESESSISDDFCDRADHLKLRSKGQSEISRLPARDWDFSSHMRRDSDYESITRTL